MRYSVVFLLLSSAFLTAAEHTGVVRVQGKGVPGVAVVAVSGEQKIATSTDETGSYRLDLPPGTPIPGCDPKGDVSVSLLAGDCGQPIRLFDLPH